MYLVSLTRFGRSSSSTSPCTTTFTASQPKAEKAPAVSGGMIDWIREAISVGFCQLKVKSRRTPASGKAGWNSRKVSGSRQSSQARWVTRFRRRLFLGSMTMTTSPRRTACVTRLASATPLPDWVVPTSKVPPSKFCNGRCRGTSRGSTPWM